MLKRFAAAYLWIMACWSLGAVLEHSFAVSETLGLVVGMVVAIVIVTMPSRMWTRRVIDPSTARTSAPPPTGLTAAD